MTVARPPLPTAASEHLSILENSEILGATRQLGIAADLFAALARDYDGEPSDLIRSARWVADHLIRLRGESSQAITNGLHLMLDGLEGQNGRSLVEIRNWIIQRVEEFKSESTRHMEDLVEIGARVVDGATRVLAYDYSSSVAAILRAVSSRREGVTLIVPEARSLDGGRKYLADLRNTALHIEFIPDAAVATIIQNCDLALVGAETLSAEGGCFNTIGTLGVALAAHYWRVPFYVASTLIKIDTRTVMGFQRPIPVVDLDHILQSPSPSGTVTVTCPDLDYTPPNLIRALISELGVVPPSIAYRYAMKISGKLEGANVASNI